MMKRAQLWLHNNYRRIRHWLLMAFAILLLGFSMFSISNQNKLIKQVKGLSTQNTQLALQNHELNVQTKRIGVDNKEISNQNRDYLRCVASIFALYTQNHEPIVITNLDKCKTIGQFTPTSDTSERNRPVTSGSAAGSVGSSSSKSTTRTGSGQSDNSQPGAGSSEPPKNAPGPSGDKLLDCKFDILILHIGCN